MNNSIEGDLMAGFTGVVRGDNEPMLEYDVPLFTFTREKSGSEDEAVADDVTELLKHLVMHVDTSVESPTEETTDGSVGPLEPHVNADAQPSSSGQSLSEQNEVPQRNASSPDASVELDRLYEEPVQYETVAAYLSIEADPNTKEVYAKNLRELAGLIEAARPRVSLLDLIKARSNPTSASALSQAIYLRSYMGDGGPINKLLRDVFEGKHRSTSLADTQWLDRLRVGIKWSLSSEANRKGCYVPDPVTVDTSILSEEEREGFDQIVMGEAEVIVIGDSAARGLATHYMKDVRPYVARVTPTGILSQIEYICNRVIVKKCKYYTQLLLILIPYADPILLDSTQYRTHADRILQLVGKFPKETPCIIAPGIPDMNLSTETVQGCMREFLSLFIGTSITTRLNSVNTEHGCSFAVKATYRKNDEDFPHTRVLIDYVDFLLPPGSEVAQKLRSDLNVNRKAHKRRGEVEDCQDRAKRTPGTQ